MRRSVQAMLFVTEDQAATDKVRARVPAGRALVGWAPEIVDAMGRYGEMGFDEVHRPRLQPRRFGRGPLGGVRADPWDVVAQVSA